MTTLLFAALILLYVAYEGSQGRGRASLLCLAIGSCLIATATVSLGIAQ